MTKGKKKRGKRKWICLTTVHGDQQDPTDIPTPYSDPFDYALRKKRGLKRKNPKTKTRKFFYVINMGGGEYSGLEVTTGKELEFLINKLKEEGRFQSIEGPWNSKEKAKEAAKRYMKE